MSQSVNLPSEDMLNINDVIHAIDYLLSLSFDAVLPSIDMKCRAFEETVNS